MVGHSIFVRLATYILIEETVILRYRNQMVDDCTWENMTMFSSGTYDINTTLTSITPLWLKQMREWLKKKSFRFWKCCFTVNKILHILILPLISFFRGSDLFLDFLFFFLCMILQLDNYPAHDLKTIVDIVLHKSLFLNMQIFFFKNALYFQVSLKKNARLILQWLLNKQRCRSTTSTEM